MFPQPQQLLQMPLQPQPQQLLQMPLQPQPQQLLQMPLQPQPQQLLQMPLQPQPQLQPQNDLWQTISKRFVCRDRLKTTGKQNAGICRGDVKKNGTWQDSIAKWGTCEELETLEKVHEHNHIITLHGGECQYPTTNQAWMAMEIAEGSLLDKLKSATAKEVSGQIREDIRTAIEHLHNQKLVHSDIKPDNILIMNDGRAVLADFGMSKPVGSICSPYGCGVYSHYSTKALWEAAVHPNRDWFAFTVVLYEMLLNNKNQPYQPLAEDPQIQRFISDGFPTDLAVRHWDALHSTAATKHYGVETKLEMFASTKVNAEPAPAPAHDIRQDRTRNKRQRTDIHAHIRKKGDDDAVAALWDGYIKQAKSCKDAVQDCQANRDRFKSYLARGRKCEHATESCKNYKNKQEDKKKQEAISKWRPCLSAQGRDWSNWKGDCPADKTLGPDCSDWFKRCEKRTSQQGNQTSAQQQHEAWNFASNIPNPYPN